MSSPRTSELGTRPGRRSNVRRANVTACVRCKQRKQRCDQSLPACGNCAQAGVDCVSTDIDGREIPRSYIVNLEYRVAHLEKELSQCRTCHSSQPADGVTSSTRLASPQASTSIVPSALISPLIALASGAGAAASTESNALLEKLPCETRAPWPSPEASQALAATYFEHSEFFSPILDPVEFQPHLAAGRATDGVNTGASFRSMMVFAVAACLVNRTDPSFPMSRSEAYYATAMQVLSDSPLIIQTATVEHLTNLALLIQYAMFHANFSMIWHFLGVATRMVIDLGLHQSGVDHPGVSSDSTSHQDRHRWLFWAIYSFERIFCNVMGRPFSLPEEVITTPLPDPEGHGDARRAALHLISGRRLLSEIHQILVYDAPLCSGAMLPDFGVWQATMRQRVEMWYDARPQSLQHSKLRPSDIWEGSLCNMLVFLYFPWPRHPAVVFDGVSDGGDADIVYLSRRAAQAVDVYRQSFREGQLRFYWRTLHNLFRAGAALVYCIKHLRSSQRRAGIENMVSLQELQSSVNLCSTILWGMVERQHSGPKYRDMFDSIVSTLDNDSDDQIPSPEPVEMMLDNLQSLLPISEEIDFFT